MHYSEPHLESHMPKAESFLEYSPEFSLFKESLLEREKKGILLTKMELEPDVAYKRAYVNLL